MKSKVNMQQKPGESRHDYLVRTSNEAIAEGEASGFLSIDQVNARMAKHKNDFYKKHAKAKAA
jgi:hypothetical protein